MVTREDTEEQAHQLPTGEVAFKAVGVKEHYPGVKALDGVDLEGYAGSVLGVCGANGAGNRPSRNCSRGWRLRRTGRSPSPVIRIRVRNAAQAVQAGVLMMHQEPLIIDDFTVGENVWPYKLREGKDIRPWAKKVDTISAETRDVLQGVGLGQLSTRQPARDLGPGQRQMLSLSGVSLDVDPGEILGLYGLVGSGRSSVARTITGQRQAVNGSISLHGQQVSLPTPASGVAKRIAYLTEDRRLEGFVKDFDNGENTSLVVLRRMANAGVVNAAVEKKRVRELITEYQVKGGTDTYTRTLSGGNQQKVVVAKWLETDPDFVVLDEPTKGIDVGARANIYEIIHSLAARGKGVLVVSSEAEELLSLCHRILVMRNGQIVGEFDPEHATTDDLIRTALSHQD